MKLLFRVFIPTFVFCKLGLIVSQESSNLAFLSNSLESLVIQHDVLEGKQTQSADISNLQNTVKNKIKTIKIEQLKEILYQPKEVNAELVKEGISWISHYYEQANNFKFLQPLSKEEQRRITENASKSLSQIFEDKKLHESQISVLDKDILRLAELFNKEKADLNNLDFNRNNISKINQKDLFLRLLNLVQLKSEFYRKFFELKDPKKALYHFDEVLGRIIYPKQLTMEALNEFYFDASLLPKDLSDADFFWNIAKNLLDMIEALDGRVGEIKTIGAAVNATNELVSGAQQLENLISRFNKNFIGSELLFNKLVENALGLITIAQLKSSENEFNKGFESLNTGQQEQVKNSLLAFATSPAIKFYNFAGAPIRSLWNEGNKLRQKLTAIVSQLKGEAELADIEKLETWFINQIFAYAVAPYSAEEELYYSRIFTYVNGEIARLNKKYKSEASIYAKSEEKLGKFAFYKEIIKKIKQFRERDLSKLYKAITMVGQNPYNKEFKNIIPMINANTLKEAEALFVKLVSSQYYIQNLIRTLTDSSLKAIDSEPSFAKLARVVIKDGETKNQSLSDYMKQELVRAKDDALKYWVFENSAETFKNAIEKFVLAPKSEKGTEDIEDILRKEITGRRQAIEEEESEDENEEEEWDF